jgi:hypothetical protein
MYARRFAQLFRKTIMASDEAFYEANKHKFNWYAYALGIREILPTNAVLQPGSPGGKPMEIASVGALR